VARKNISPLHRQIARATRRLFAQTLAGGLLWSWFAASLVCAAWFIAQPHLWPDLTMAGRLILAGAVFAAASITAVLWAVFRAPSRLAAALLLDERFELRERVTSSLLLSPELKESSAGQALLVDVDQRIRELNVGSRFPVRVGWGAGLAPIAATVLALAAFYYQPATSRATQTNTDQKTVEPVVNAKEIEQKINQLKKRSPERRDPKQELSEELKKIDAELDQIANKPRSTKEQLKERIKEMTELEDRLKNRERDMAERTRSLRQQLQQLGKMGEGGENREGPAKEMQKALSEGKFDKAREEMDRLAKKLKEDRLTAKEREQLAQQLDKLQDKLERLAQQKDKLAELEKLAKEGKLNREALKKEMEQIKQDSEKLKSMQKLANQLAQAQQALKKGKSSDAGKALSDAANQMKDLDQESKDLQDLRDQLSRLRDAKNSC
jgi:septal ring factor EnvC (AmiA/AmiB activator)